MSSSYEVWLTDDYGVRRVLFDKFSSLTYSRTTRGYGTCNLIIPYKNYLKQVGPSFHPDWRIDIWRSPMERVPARREASFFLRKPIIYQRESDAMLMIELLGRSPLDILRRQIWKTNTIVSKPADDFMKYIVRGMYVNNTTSRNTAPAVLSGGTYVSTGEFAVDADSSDGPIVPKNFFTKNIIDACQELKSATYTLNATSSANKKIYFDVIEDESLSSVGGFGYRFRTYPNLRGKDRTSGLQFSVDNGNISGPTYYEDYLDEFTAVSHYNNSQSWSPQVSESQRRYASRWNYSEKSSTSSENNQSADLTKILGELRDLSPSFVLNTDFVNSPGSQTQPRSLYGVDWDLGDLLPVKFADSVYNTEVVIIYVSVNENAQEKISGKSTVGV